MSEVSPRIERSNTSSPPLSWWRQTAPSPHDSLHAMRSS